MIFLPFFVFIFGLLIGSFLNVVILRLNTGRSIVTGRSKCARCSRVLEWYELLPVFSFLGLRGKCRTCHAPISFQYALVELSTAIAFTVLYTSIFLTQGFMLLTLLSFLFACTIASILLVITVYDIRHKIIPDVMSYTFIALSLVSVIWKTVMLPGFMPVSAFIAGPFLALPFFLLWFLSKGRLMGFGDVKLMLGIGWLLGLTLGFTAMLLAFWIGGIIGLFLLAGTRKYSMKSQIPFAPFLIAGTVIAGVWGVPIAMMLGLWR